MMTDNTTTTTDDDRRLVGFGANAVELGVPQRVFGILVELAAPIVEHYRSDFYHDAAWIGKQLTDDNLRESFTFFYGADDYGTAIGTDVELVRYSRPAHVWQLMVYLSARFDWRVSIAEVTA